MKKNSFFLELKSQGFLSGCFALKKVLRDAIEQAESGKGRERHAEEGEPFERQIICEVTRRLGSGYPLGQAVKKIYESQRLGGEKGVAELLGAINYIAAAVIVMRERGESEGSSFQNGNGSPEAEAQPEFKPGDKVRANIGPNGKWKDMVYYCKDFAGNHLVGFENAVSSGDILYVADAVRPAPKTEGCEELVQKDAPQTPQELYQHIVDCNPSIYKPRTPTGEELAEMAEEETHG